MAARVNSPAVAFALPYVAPPVTMGDAPARVITPPVLFKEYAFGPGEGHWVTIDGEHVLIRGGRPGGHKGGGKPARERGYEGDAEGLIHPDAVKVRHALLDAAAPHEAKLVEHDAAIARTSETLKAAAKDSDNYDSGEPGYRDAVEKMVKAEDEQAIHLEAKQKVFAAMHAALHPLLHAPQAADVQAQSFTKVGAPQAKEATAAFNQLVSPQVAHGTANFRQAKVRANYEPGGDRITLAKTSSVRVGVHELGHWLERHNQAVSDKAVRFLNYRTQGERAQPLRTLANNPNYDKGEVSRPDKFAHPYMGKEYGSGTVRDQLPGEDSYRYYSHTPTEIMSMGLERLSNAHDALALAKADPEMFDFIVSTARGLNK
jgi:hypothetical protein